MKQTFKISASEIIGATEDKVWDILTNPDKIKMYLGLETITDWKPGSAVVWQGEFNGQKFRDKGKVLENNFGKLLKFEYWSSFGGYEDTPENYSIVTYSLEKADSSRTKFTYTREKIPSESEYRMFEEHLPHMIQSIKELAEQ